MITLVNMNDEEIVITGDENWNEARSLPPGTPPPNGAIEVCREKTDKDTYYYYKDPKGNLYFQTKNTLEFESWMQERNRVTKIKKGWK